MKKYLMLAAVAVLPWLGLAACQKSEPVKAPVVVEEVAPVEPPFYRVTPTDPKAGVKPVQPAKKKPVKKTTKHAEPVEPTPQFFLGIEELPIPMPRG